MFYILTVILITIGALGIAVYSGVTLLQATQTTTDTLSDLRRMEMVAWNLRNNGSVYSATYNSYTSRQLGATYTSYYVPDPSVFATPFTVGGLNFHYCPYTSLSTNTTSFAIATPSASNDYTGYYGQLGTTTSNQRILTRTTSTPDSDAPSDTLHVLTMASSGATASPQCNALSTTNNILTASGGRVAAITAKQSINRHAYAASKIMNLYIATAATGDGSGRDANNYMTLDNAMTLWRTIQPRITYINLAAGTYTADSNTLSASGLPLGNPLGAKLIWKGASAATTTINVSGAATVDFPVNFQIETLTFGSSTTDFYVRKGGNLYVNSTTLTLNKLYIHSGEVEPKGTTVIFATANGIDIGPAGKLMLVNALNVTTSTGSYGIQVFGGQIRTRAVLDITVPNGGTAIRIVSGVFQIGSTTNLSAGSGNLARGIWVYPGGQVINSGGAVLTVNSNPTIAAIDNAGFVSGYAAGLLVPNGAAVGIRLIEGGELDFSNASYIGSSTDAAQRPLIGIQDAGGSRIAGGAATGVYAITKCWEGTVTPNLFSDSAEGNGQFSTSLGTSAPTDYRYLRLDNRSVIPCIR